VTDAASRGAIRFNPHPAMTEPTVTITSAGSRTTAEFVPGANLLCCSLRHRGAELLDPGRGVQAYAQRGATMGIPLLYPWANRLSRPEYAAAGRTVQLPAAPDGRYPVDPTGLPIHGAMPGELRWELAERAPDRLRATLAWRSAPLLALFPFRHRVEVQAGVDERRLSITTMVHADAGDPVPVSFGYHPYLTLPGSERRGWQVDLGATQRLVLDAQMIPTGERVPLRDRDFLLADSSWDEGLAGLSTPAQFLVSDGERALSLTFEQGYDWAQVYAPPGHDFICFEPMTAPTDALRSGEGLTVIAPGESYRASFAVTVTP
jgi:galactose mutarotase-like enzyme